MYLCKHWNGYDEFLRDCERCCANCANYSNQYARYLIANHRDHSLANLGALLSSFVHAKKSVQQLKVFFGPDNTTTLDLFWYYLPYSSRLATHARVWQTKRVCSSDLEWIHRFTVFQIQLLLIAIKRDWQSCWRVCERDIT